ncbi:MAG TPA: YoaK family protein [Gaiellaceae bacterium]|nr:YoaK family protein [Gaiellaceae bacterium]
MTAAAEVSSLRHPLPRALLVLTFTTGIVDAVSFLGLGRVFTANMTGNVVLLGFGLAGSGGLPIAAPFTSLGAFVLGSLVGGRVARLVEERRLLSAALAIEVAVLAVAAVVAGATTITPGSGAAYAVIVLLALAMGVRSSCVRRLGVPDLSTVVLTMTVIGLAADSPLAGGSGLGSLRRVSAVVLMGAGAITGALLLRHDVALPLAVAAGLALVTRECFRRAIAVF